MIRENSILGRGNKKCQGYEVGMKLLCSRDTELVSMANTNLEEVSDRWYGQPTKDIRSWDPAEPWRQWGGAGL